MASTSVRSCGDERAHEVIIEPAVLVVNGHGANERHPPRHKNTHPRAPVFRLRIMVKHLILPNSTNIQLI
jgi:hypothetical protein